MTPNTPGGDSVRPDPRRAPRQRLDPGDNRAGPGHVRTQRDGRRPRRVEANSPAADHLRRSYDGRIPRAIRAHSPDHCRPARRLESLRSRARHHRPDRRHVLCGRPPTERDRNPASARRRAPPCPVARPSGRRFPGRHGRDPRCRPGRSLSLVRFPPWIPISLRSWVPLSGIRFCSSARRCCSSRRHCSPVPCPLGRRYGLTRRRPCGRSDRTPGVFHSLYTTSGFRTERCAVFSTCC